MSERGTAANKRMNLPVRVVTPLAYASVAPTRPTGYAKRYTDQSPRRGMGVELTYEHRRN